MFRMRNITAPKKLSCCCAFVFTKNSLHPKLNLIANITAHNVAINIRYNFFCSKNPSKNAAQKNFQQRITSREVSCIFQRWHNFSLYSLNKTSFANSKQLNSRDDNAFNTLLTELCYEKKSVKLLRLL